MRNLLSNQTEATVDWLTYESSSVFTLFWNILWNQLPEEINQDFEAWLQGAQMVRMDTMGSQDSTKGIDNYNAIYSQKFVNLLIMATYHLNSLYGTWSCDQGVWWLFINQLDLLISLPSYSPLILLSSHPTLLSSYSPLQSYTAPHAWKVCSNSLFIAPL